MPKLWTDTIAAHRRQVHEAILDAAAALVVEHGLRAVTMAQIADRTGIGRATLYKYFPDVETILRTWHHREISAHLAQLADARDRAHGVGPRLDAVLREYAHIAQRTRGHDNELVRFLHRGEDLAETQRSLHDLITGLVVEAARAGDIRNDIPPGEVATYCLHALNAAAALPSAGAADRLVTLTLAALGRPPYQTQGDPRDSGVHRPPG